MKSPFFEDLVRHQRYLNILMLTDFTLGIASVILSFLPGLEFLFGLIPFTIVFIIFVFQASKVAKLQASQLNWQTKEILSNLENLAAEQISKIEDLELRKIKEEELNNLSREH